MTNDVNLPHDFDEALISGYLDGELTHQDRQRVELHLDACADCRRIAEELQQLTGATMTSAFAIPEDTQWDETPRNGLSRILQILGWSLAGLWAFGLVVFLIWQAVNESESTRFEALIGLAPLAAVTLIFGSALIDRIETRKTDPYRKVQK